MKSKKIKKILIVLCIICLLIGGAFGYIAAQKAKAPLDMGACPDISQTVEQPFVPFETSDSEIFRIPAIISLDSGRLVAAADARYDSGLDGGGLDTVVAYSDDFGLTWTSSTINYLPDGGNKYEPKASTFIDPEILTDGENIWLMTTFFSGNRNLMVRDGIKKPVKANAFDENGNLLLSDNNGKSFDFYADINNFTDGKTDIIDKDGNATGYTVDEFFYLYDNEGMDCGNIFYLQSKVKFSVVPTCFLYMRKSEDGGETFGTPTLINLKEEGELFFGVGPGRGLYGKDGTLYMSVYTFFGSASSQRAGFIFSKDGGNTWQRSPLIESDKKFDYSGESQLIQLKNGDIRCFIRNGSNRLCYADAKYDGTNYVWSEVVVMDDIPTTSSCMLSAIDFENYIFVSCPTKHDGNKTERADGKIFVFRTNKQGDMNLINTIDVNEGFFAYSCLAINGQGNLSMLYEDEAGHITYTTYDWESLIKE